VHVDVVTEIEIDRPRERVAEYAADPDNAVEWYANIDAVEWRSSPPAEIGSDIAFTARFLGRSLTYTYRIIELVAGERLVMSAAEGPFPMETTYTWRDTPDGGTRMTLRNRGRPRGFVGVASPLMARSMRRANVKDLRQLKAILEAERG
jgi:uncharacterized protein YndB with AHSA1/START domain